MQTTTSLPTGQLKRFNIRIVTGGETAIKTAIARSNEQAWNIAFDLCERLLGDTPPRSISVKPVGVSSGLYLPAGQSLQARAVGRPVRSAVCGHTPIVVQKDAPLAVPCFAIEADGLNLLGRQSPSELHTPITAHQGLVATV